jgi:hypothetical protein
MNTKPLAVLRLSLLVLAYSAVAHFAKADETLNVPTASKSGFVADVKQRVETDRFEVIVYQGKTRVQLERFVQLLVIAPLQGRTIKVENLVRRSVAIVPPDNRRTRWGVYMLSSVGFLAPRQWLVLNAFYDPAQRQHRSGGAQELADNVFLVKQVIISSERDPVKLRLDGEVIRLKPGEALLVL